MLFTSNTYTTIAENKLARDDSRPRERRVFIVIVFRAGDRDMGLLFNLLDRQLKGPWDKRKHEELNEGRIYGME